MAASSLQELAAMHNLTTCELDKRRHLVYEFASVIYLSGHQVSPRCRFVYAHTFLTFLSHSVHICLCQHQSSGICFNYVLSDKNDRLLIL